MLMQPLCVCFLRLSNFLFPPIPRPPQKYQYFLEKIDPLSVSPRSEMTQVPFHLIDHATTNM